jgi:hypothetical protein
MGKAQSILNKVLIGMVVFLVLLVVQIIITAQEIRSTKLHVVTSENMQPFGLTPEDEWTATLALQPTYSAGLQTPRHWLFLQEAKQPSVTSSEELQANDVRYTNMEYRYLYGALDVVSSTNNVTLEVQ